MQASHALTALVEKEDESFTPLSDFADGRDAQPGPRLLPRSNTRARLPSASTSPATSAATTTTPSAISTRGARPPRCELRSRPAAARQHRNGGKIADHVREFRAYSGLLHAQSRTCGPRRARAGMPVSSCRSGTGRAMLDVTYFEQDLRNKINGFAPGPGFTFTAVNTPGTSQRDGVEVSGRVALTPSLMLSGAYTHLTATDASRIWRRSAGRGIRAASISRISSTTAAARPASRRSTTARWTIPPSASTATSSVSRSRRPSVSGSTTTGSSTLAASYKVMPGVEVFGRVENLFNERYYEIYGFDTPGVAGFGGVKLTFGGEGEPASSAEPKIGTAVWRSKDAYAECGRTLAVSACWRCVRCLLACRAWPQRSRRSASCRSICAPTRSCSIWCRANASRRSRIWPLIRASRRWRSRRAASRRHAARPRRCSAFDPDLVIAGTYSTPATVALLERVGRRVVKVPLASRSRWHPARLVAKIAAAVGEAERGEAADRRLRSTAGGGASDRSGSEQIRRRSSIRSTGSPRDRAVSPTRCSLRLAFAIMRRHFGLGRRRHAAARGAGGQSAGSARS